MSEPLDHGMLNVPLAKRAGDIDAQIDRYMAEQARIKRQEGTAIFHSVRAKKAHVKELLAALPDERVMALASPLGCRKPSTARASLASAASSHLDRWIAALEREVVEIEGQQ